MPRVDKTAFTQFTTTGCEKQLRIALHPTTKRYQSERDAIDLPHPQIRPALREIEAAGNEWGDAKVRDLDSAFGAERLLGGRRSDVGGATSPGLHFADSELLDHLTAGVAPGDFLVESEYDAATHTFLNIHGLQTVDLEGIHVSLDFARVRPDIIEVLAPEPGSPLVNAEGQVLFTEPDDVRPALRIIDIKLTSEPGPRYFAELAYYSLALAGWLREHGLEEQFAVSARAGVWPGSEQKSPLQTAITNGGDRYAAFHEGLEIAPLRIFVAEVLRVLREIIPRVLTTPYADLPWAVNPGCQGCENLGQKFQEEPGDHPSDWDPRHCLPTAHTTQDLSRLPFVSRGSMKVLRSRGHNDINAVAALDPSDPTFDAHHRLRGQRGVVGARARALTGSAVTALDAAVASTAAIPGWAKLRVYLTADFDPGSAITLAFGLTWGWVDSTGQLTSVSKMRVHYTSSKTVEDEWAALSAVLDDLTALLDEAERRDPTATVQVYVWDELTLDHVTRVVSRHLATILANGQLARLAWLFPPEELVGSARLALTPAVSIVKDAVRSLLSLDLAHTYSLVETARRFHRADHPNPTFYVPTFWSDPFSDQIPPERAHQVWRGRRAPGAPTPAQLTSALLSTVRSKLAALSNVTDHLTNELKGRLPREAPRINQLGAPKDLAAASHLGALVFAHAKLDAALQSLKVSRARALPVAERESKFESARFVRELSATDSIDALARFGLAPASNRHVYELAAGSTEVKAKDGSFAWLLIPEAMSHMSHWGYARFVRHVADQSLLDKWSTAHEIYTQSLSDTFGATVVKLDRARRVIVIDLNIWGVAGQMRQDLIDRNHVDLTRDLVLDPTSKDFFTSKLEETIRAIGNPPSADRDPRMQRALGTRRNPRVSIAHPAEDFLWTPETTETQVVSRDVITLRTTMVDRGRTLNDSQWQAWTHALTRRLTLIWGPPGTGKTSTVQTIIAALAEDAARVPLRIAVAAATYTAIDNVIGNLVLHLDVHAPHAAVRRLRSAGNSAPGWLLADQDVPTDGGAAFRATVERLDRSETTIVAGTPQQLKRLLASTATAAGPVFDVIIIDEAGAMDVGHALLVIAGAAQGASLIIAGDPKQLPPIHEAEAPLGLEAYVGSIYDFFGTAHHISPQELLVNYRSNAEIVELSRRAGYPALLSSFRPDLRIAYSDEGLAIAAVPSEPTVWPAKIQFSQDLVDLASPERPVACFIYPEGVSGQWNQFEADLVTAIVSWYSQSLAMPSGGAMTDEYFWTEGIGVVTPHRAQRARIVEGLIALFCGPGTNPDLPRLIDDAIDTVERFQGQERDVIVASYAVGDPDTIAEEAEFLLNLNRFNVLSTRPRSKLVVLATRELIDHMGSDLDIIRSSELLKDFVDLYCDQKTSVVVGWQDDGTARTIDSELRWH